MIADHDVVALLARIAALEQASKRQATFPGSSLDLIEGKNANAGAVASFDFQIIPAVYFKLVIDLYARGDTAATSFNLHTTVNNDGSALYDSELAAINGAAPALGGNQQLAQAYWLVSVMAAANAPAGAFDSVCLELPAYANTNGQKVGTMSGTRKLANSTGNLYTHVGSFWYRSTNAISRITLTPSAGNFAQYSTARLYGVY